ncbi:hypothetical protein HPB48_026960 [Haemaphysalis longicornis]|uniref:Uncharacterized protein n=1 Tax=Haemaphysalis longicornis TaxID=44386 RepID=A0A9J6HDH3_HAELO|nr:hypothetical protein HPB48_026960 [Haemaphysalis longicornis]
MWMGLPSDEEYAGDEFAVVIFPEEDCSLGIVHESWLNEDHDKTLWPNEKNPNKRRRLTVQGAAPTEAWIEVKCSVKAWAVEPSKKHGEDDDDEDSNESDNNTRRDRIARTVVPRPLQDLPSLPSLTTEYSAHTTLWGEGKGAGDKHTKLSVVYSRQETARKASTLLGDVFCTSCAGDANADETTKVLSHLCACKQVPCEGQHPLHARSLWSSSSVIGMQAAKRQYGIEPG